MDKDKLDKIISTKYISRFERYVIEAEDEKQLDKKWEKTQDIIEYYKNRRIREWRTIKIPDIVEIVKTITKDINECYDGEYPLVSNSKENNGIVRYIDEYDIDNTTDKYLTISKRGVKGKCYYHDYKFSITKDVILLRVKDETQDYNIISGLIEDKLVTKYETKEKIRKEDIMNEMIQIPVYE